MRQRRFKQPGRRRARPRRRGDSARRRNRLGRRRICPGGRQTGTRRVRRLRTGDTAASGLRQGQDLTDVRPSAVRSAAVHGARHILPEKNLRLAASIEGCRRRSVMLILHGRTAKLTRPVASGDVGPGTAPGQRKAARQRGGRTETVLNSDCVRTIGRVGPSTGSCSACLCSTSCELTTARCHAASLANFSLWARR